MWRPATGGNREMYVPVNEAQPLLPSQQKLGEPSFGERAKSSLFKSSTIFCLVLVAIGIPALAVRGTAKDEDVVVLAVIVTFCGLYVLMQLLPDTNVKSPALFSRTMPESIQKLKSGSPIPLALVLILIAVIAQSLPIHAHNGSSRWLRAQSLIGMVVFLVLLYITSNDRKRISWQPVWVGVLFQFLMALFVLRTWIGYNIFKFLSHFVETYLGFSVLGLEFLFGDSAGNAAFFAAEVFPAIIFFCGTVQLLFHFGVLQAVIKKFAVFFYYTMDISGAEAIVAAASPFIGQGENALLVQPFVKDMTRSEIHQIMTSGFATVAGSTMYAYMKFGVSPQYLITAAMMSVPCAIALSKLRYPETEIPCTKQVVAEIPGDHYSGNALQAFGKGARTGMKIVLVIAAALLSIISLVGAINAFLTWFGHFFNIHSVTIQIILKYLFYPVAWLMGVTPADLLIVAELLGEKIAVNEFVAYLDMVPLINKGAITEHSGLIITYALCGFANISSIANQIGILGTLAPNRLSDFSELALSAMITGAMSTCFSAMIAGMML